MSGSMSGRWRRGMVQLMGHRQTKGPVTVRQHLNYRATSRLYHARSRRLLTHLWKCFVKKLCGDWVNK